MGHDNAASMRVKANPKRILSTYCIPNVGLYLLGTFDVGVTVLSQQIRALNLAWALVETERVPADKRIAVVGGGFAGLTIAAGLLRKEAQVHITIFERRDTLLPLQQGSDTRWLHPRIYDWPAMGSEAGSAMLPILNWTAARASDVVVQVMREWQKTLDDAPEALKGNLALYCNTRHLQVHLATGNSRNLRIEWVGERRSPSDGVSLQNGMSVATGGSQEFDIVILAVGFGLERDQALSYWRNEILAQPNLDRPRLIYVVSGQGDGAMMDLFRLRIAQFRQDRILSELFEGKAALLAKLRTLQETYQDNASKGGLFDALESFYDETQDELRLSSSPSPGVSAVIPKSYFILR